MKALSFTILLSALTATLAAQKTFTIHGSISLLTKSKTVRLMGYPPATIQPDGSFELTGETNNPDLALIMTDSSLMGAIWLTPGKYTVQCEEFKQPDHRGISFRTTSLEGPADAERYNDFQEQMYTGFGLAGQKANAFRYMDSILKITNSSPILPAMLRSVQHILGDDTTSLFIRRLAPELKNNPEIAMLEGSVKRKEKIKKEKTFENFDLKNVGDSSFALSSLTGKKAILIDFWASSCGPCRMAHPRLKEWYAKYASKGLEIVSISIDDSKEKWLKAIKDDGIGNWINVADPNGFNASLMRDYYIPYIPFRFLLDENKNIVLVDNAQDTWITEKDIASILNK